MTCGISQTVSRAGHFGGRCWQAIDQSLTQNSDQIQHWYLAGQLGLAATATALYTAQASHTKRITVYEQGRSITVAKTQKASLQISEQDKRTMEAIQAAINEVEDTVGQTDIQTIAIGDDFGFSQMVGELGQRQLAAKAKQATGFSRLSKKAAGQYYRLLKPILVGKLYLGTKLGSSPLAVAGQETGEIAFNQKYLGVQKQDKKGHRLDYGRYVATHEALHQVKREPQKQRLMDRLFTRQKEEALVDAIAARLVNPEYRGRRSGYDTIRRLADWQARLIASRTGEQPLAVLIRQLKAHPQPLRGV